MLRTFFTAAVLLATTALAQVPTKVTFTARLVDAGAPVQGPRDFVFSLFTTVVAGTAVWTETRNAVTVTDGMVNVDLGASTPLTDAIFDGQTLYLEVSVGGTALSPRTAVLSVPYALRSTTAQRVGTASEADLQRRVSANCPSGSAIRAIAADGTVTCQAAGANDAGMSGITGVFSGTGLTGGGAVGSVTLAADFAGSGTANTVSRSDHNHSGTYLPRGTTLACTGTNKVSSIDSAGNVVCTADSTGGTGTVTSVGTGAGLTGGPITTTGTIGLAASVQNWSTQPSCGAGRVMREISAAGVPTCETDQNSGGTVTSVGTGTGLTGGPIASTGTIGLAATVQNWASQPTCASGQFLRGVAADGTPTCVGPVLVDSAFNISVQGGAGVFAAIWVPICTGTCPNITIPGTYAYGSTSGTVTVARSGPGSYSVTIPGVGSSVPQVTAYGGLGVFCKINNWGGGTYSVACYNSMP